MFVTSGSLRKAAALRSAAARVGASGFYDAAAVWIAGQAGRPLRLLALTIAVSGALSAQYVCQIRPLHWQV